MENEYRTYYATAIKSGHGLQINIAQSAIRGLNLTKGEEVEVKIRKTGIKPEPKRTGFIGGKVIQKEAPVETPVMQQVREMKAKGKGIPEIKAHLELETDTSWEDLPEAFRAEIEE